MRTNLVSIIMPVRNHAPYLREAIDSVLNQTFEDWELIIVDDCSTDQSSDIIQYYLKRDQRIKAHFLEKPFMRAGLVRNVAIENAQGRFCAFLDADDIWLHDKLEKQIYFMLENDSAFSSTHISLIDQDGNFLRDYTPSIKTVAWNDMIAECYVSTSATVLDLSRIQNVKFLSYKYAQDYAYWMDILKQGYSVEIIPELMTYYRINNKFYILRKIGRIFYRWHIHYFQMKRPFWLSIMDCFRYALAGYKKHMYKT